MMSENDIKRSKIGCLCQIQNQKQPEIRNGAKQISLVIVAAVVVDVTAAVVIAITTTNYRRHDDIT